jgi:ribulose-phosphate 3-epimerase
LRERAVEVPPFDVSASIMCGRLGELADDLHELEMAGVDSIHVDIMDGHFVPNLTFGPDIVRTISSSTRLPIHAHMMVTKPEAFVGKMADAGAAAYLFHIEAAPFPLRLIEQVTQAGMVPGIAINPSTPLSFLRDVEAPIVLLMSVEPGFAGQRWVPSTAMRLERVRALLSRDVVVGVDGNVTPENVALAAKRGATLFVCGTSSLFTTDHDYADAVASIRAAAAVSATTPVG